MKKNNKSNKEELEKIRKLNLLDKILKRTDIENTLLSNSSKDSESVNDSFIDSVLEKTSNDPHINNELKVLDDLTKKENPAKNIAHHIKHVVKHYAKKAVGKTKPSASTASLKKKPRPAKFAKKASAKNLNAKIAAKKNTQSRKQDSKKSKSKSKKKN